MSKPQDVFPGTNERTLLVRGTLSQVAAAVYAIYTRLLLEDCAPVYRQIDDDEGSSHAAAGSRSSHSSHSSHSSPSSPSTSGGSSREGTPERGAEGGGDAPAAGTPGTPGSLSPFNVSSSLYHTPSAVLQVKMLVPEQFIGIIVGRKGGY